MNMHELIQDSEPLPHFLAWWIGILTFTLGGLSLGILYKKERAEEKYWVQFFGKIFPYVFAIFLIFLTLTLFTWII